MSAENHGLLLPVLTVLVGICLSATFKIDATKSPTASSVSLFAIPSQSISDSAVVSPPISVLR